MMRLCIVLITFACCSTTVATAAAASSSSAAFVSCPSTTRQQQQPTWIPFISSRRRREDDRTRRNIFYTRDSSQSSSMSLFAKPKPISLASSSADAAVSNGTVTSVSFDATTIIVPETSSSKKKKEEPQKNGKEELNHDENRNAPELAADTNDKKNRQDLNPLIQSTVDANNKIENHKSKDRKEIEPIESSSKPKTTELIEQQSQPKKEEKRKMINFKNKNAKTVIEKEDTTTTTTLRPTAQSEGFSSTDTEEQPSKDDKQRQPKVVEQRTQQKLLETVEEAATTQTAVGKTMPSPPKQQRNNRRQNDKPANPAEIREHSPLVVPTTGFNVVLTHCTADFDSLASAVGLAKLWSAEHAENKETLQQQGEGGEDDQEQKVKKFDSVSHVPTFVVLPRGAHPGVQRFLALHKHLFPIRSLKSLPSDLSNLNRLALVDAQRRDRLGPAEHLLQYANHITVVDHHIDQDSDVISSAKRSDGTTCTTDYVVDKVGSVSTLIVERLMKTNLTLTAAETTLLALGIHADTGSLCFDSTTPRDAMALAWCLMQGASQAAIAEHAQSSLSPEQQGVLTQALIHTNSTVVHGVTVSTVLLQADDFIQGLAAVTHDALEISSSDVFLLALVYQAQSGGKRRSKNKQKDLMGKTADLLTTHVLDESSQDDEKQQNFSPDYYNAMYAEAWKGGEDALRRERLKSSFEQRDTDKSGYLCRSEVAAALASSGFIASPDALEGLFVGMDSDGDGRVDLEEFIEFANKGSLPKNGSADNNGSAKGNGGEGKSSKASTMIVIGRVRAGVNTKNVKLNKLFEPFGGGGHPKAASATARLSNPSEARDVLQGMIDELIETSLQQQPTVGDFMTAPVLAVQPHMTEKQVEDLFTRYDVRALPVVDDKNEVIGLVTYKEVAAAKQRAYNKEQKRLQRQQQEAARKAAEDAAAAAEGNTTTPINSTASSSNNNSTARREPISAAKQFAARQKAEEREKKQGSAVKAWMLQHVRTVEASKTMAEVESILLENDVGCIPVVADGTLQLVGMVTRTDLLRQHRYYPTLHYHNKGFADSIAARKPIIALRKKLKQFDID